MTTLLLLLASLPAPSAEAVHTLDLGTLSFHDARNLDGRAVRVSYTADSADATDSRGVLVEAAGQPGLLRCVRFAPGVHVPEPEAGERHVAEGVLRVRWHPARVIDGETFAAVVEVKIVEAMTARL